MEEIEKIINELLPKKKQSRNKFVGDIGVLCCIKPPKWIHYDVFSNWKKKSLLFYPPAPDVPL